MFHPVVLVAIIASAAFWMGYLYDKGRFRKEPVFNLAAACLLGFAAGFLCFEAYKILRASGLTLDFSSMLRRSSRTRFFLYSVFEIGVIEELFKFFPFYIAVLRWKDFDEKIDGVVYAAVIAFGFASFENLFYLPRLRGFSLFGRAMASPLTHSIFSSFWGYLVGLAVIRKKPLLPAAAAGILLAGFIHGVFDYLTSSDALRLFSALLILVIWVWQISFLEKEGARRLRKSPTTGERLPPPPGG
ncbi:MAG: PrsW family glutamic-type intramembrane protease [Acidobacteriota bacterium]|nr:PrsW family glutamic-type intramembrane protease [Acidobacteriota bacterium]